jgi:transcriptional antiterminator NusG
MIEANLIGEIPHIIKGKCYRIFRRNKGGEPVPLRLSEVNRMLGKVDELAVNADTFYTFNLGETIKVVDLLMVSMVLLKKLMKRSVN